MFLAARSGACPYGIPVLKRVCARVHAYLCTYTRAYIHTEEICGLEMQRIIRGLYGAGSWVITLMLSSGTQTYVVLIPHVCGLELTRVSVPQNQRQV